MSNKPIKKHLKPLEIEYNKELSKLKAKATKYENLTGQHISPPKRPKKITAGSVRKLQQARANISLHGYSKKTTKSKNTKSPKNDSEQSKNKETKHKKYLEEKVNNQVDAEQEFYDRTGNEQTDEVISEAQRVIDEFIDRATSYSQLSKEEFRRIMNYQYLSDYFYNQRIGRATDIVNELSTIPYVKAKELANKIQDNANELSHDIDGAIFDSGDATSSADLSNVFSIINDIKSTPNEASKISSPNDYADSDEMYNVDDSTMEDYDYEQ